MRSEVVKLFEIISELIVSNLNIVRVVDPHSLYQLVQVLQLPLDEGPLLEVNGFVLHYVIVVVIAYSAVLYNPHTIYLNYSYVNVRIF